VSTVGRAKLNQASHSATEVTAVTSILVVGLALAVVLFIVTTSRDRAAFNDRFPPISDAEFLARCSPGVNPDVALKIRRIVAEHFAVEYERVHPLMTFIEDIGAD
jgi:hypothetical protein